MTLRRLTHLASVACLSALSIAASADDEWSRPTVVKDADYGEVLFYFFQEDYFPAIVRLMAAQKKNRVENHAGEAELLLGGLYLSYGHHREAAAIFERLLAGRVHPQIRDRTWFFLAKIWHQRGYLKEAQQALDNIGSNLPESLVSERRMLQASLHIDRGDHATAIGLLGQWPEGDPWSSYARFNLGVALVRSGQVSEAAALLDELGGMNPPNEEMRALRDKANLALGYAFLQDGQPRAAKVPLNRVRLAGPFSNKALLGIGWADAETDNFRRALVPWMELRGRDLLDPAVQESMLAIPYAMARLDSVSQAADHYLNAIEAFYEEANRIDGAVLNIENGTLLSEFLADDADATTGWHWQLDALPERPESRYLYHLMSTHRFQEGLKNYRDLHYLWRNLDRWQRSVDVFRNMLSTRELAYERRLPVVTDSLAAADVDSLVARKLQFDAELNNIEKNSDALALATRQEFALWREIAAVEANPALQADLPEAADARHKVRLLKGALQWNLDKSFSDRLWRIRRDLRQTGEALIDTRRARRQIDESMQIEPDTFLAFEDRIGGLGPQIDELKSRVEDVMRRQQTFMFGVAVEELRAQRARLDTYTVQARFALAAIYDLAATEATLGAASE